MIVHYFLRRNCRLTMERRAEPDGNNGSVAASGLAGGSPVNYGVGPFVIVPPTLDQHPCLLQSPFRGILKLAGAAGFEPANGGIKSRCLTTWRRPNTAEAPAKNRPQTYRDDVWKIRGLAESCKHAPYGFHTQFSCPGNTACGVKTANNGGKQETADGKRETGNCSGGRCLGQDILQPSTVDQKQVLGGLGGGYVAGPPAVMSPTKLSQPYYHGTRHKPGPTLPPGPSARASPAQKGGLHQAACAARRQACRRLNRNGLRNR